MIVISAIGWLLGAIGWALLARAETREEALLREIPLWKAKAIYWREAAIRLQSEREALEKAAQVAKGSVTSAEPWVNVVNNARCVPDKTHDVLLTDPSFVATGDKSNPSGMKT